MKTLRPARMLDGRCDHGVPGRSRKPGGTFYQRAPLDVVQRVEPSGQTLHDQALERCGRPSVPHAVHQLVQGSVSRCPTLLRLWHPSPAVPPLDSRDRAATWSLPKVHPRAGGVLSKLMLAVFYYNGSGRGRRPALAARAHEAGPARGLRPSGRKGRSFRPHSFRRRRRTQCGRRTRRRPRQGRGRHGRCRRGARRRSPSRPHSGLPFPVGSRLYTSTSTRS